MPEAKLLCIRSVRCVYIFLFLCCSLASISGAQAETGVSLSQSAQQVAVYDFVEITATLNAPAAQNPFTEVSIQGTFRRNGAGESKEVDGFCDSSDGTVFKLRFMPDVPGDYTYRITFQAAGHAETHTGSFKAIDEHRRGPLRVDPENRWHFIWEGTGEHYFFNGTTAYWITGWRDDRTIEFSLDRLHRLKINRLRTLLSGRTFTMYGEPVMNTEAFSVFLSPWPAVKADDFYHPGFDYTRFNVAHWQKYERMLRMARERDMIISVVLDIGDGRIHPEPYSDDERRYIRYAVARLGAFSNITWDLGDDLDAFRDDKWAHETGTLIESWDPWKHLATSHPIHWDHQDRAADWFGFTSIQDWSRPQHALMLEQREIQKKTGRIIPQTNEEYGYEDHYPLWAPAPPGDSADTLRRMAWEIAMAGAYQTTGESARRGTGIWPNTGGGWMNGRGDDTMTMLAGYAHIYDFFTSFSWWKTEPHDELVDAGAFCLAAPGSIYAVYLPHGGSISIKLEPGKYKAQWFAASTGEQIPLPDVEGPAWKSPAAPDGQDWALLLQRR